MQNTELETLLKGISERDLRRWMSGYDTTELEDGCLIESLISDFGECAVTIAAYSIS